MVDASCTFYLACLLKCFTSNSYCLQNHFECLAQADWRELCTDDQEQSEVFTIAMLLYKSILERLQPQMFFVKRKAKWSFSSTEDLPTIQLANNFEQNLEKKKNFGAKGSIEGSLRCFP